jgi:hypothetical protein
MNDNAYEIPHNGQIFYPNVRQIPDNICKQLGLSIGTLVNKQESPFLNVGELIPVRFWKLVNKPQFNGLTSSDIYAIINRTHHHYNFLVDNLDTDKGVWKHLRAIFVHSHPHITDTVTKKYDAIIQWLNKEMTECLNTFYDLCVEQKLPPIRDTDLGHRSGYAYIVVADASSHDVPDENTVCVTTDLSHAHRVAEYLCTVISMLKKDIDVTVPEDYIDMFIHKKVWDVHIRRVPVMAELNHENQEDNTRSVPLLSKRTLIVADPFSYSSSSIEAEHHQQSIVQV